VKIRLSINIASWPAPAPIAAPFFQDIKAMAGPITEATSRPWRWHFAAFWAIVLIGGFVRFHGLGHIPAGLNGDEAEKGVEAISLLATSTDRWGDRFPVFFPHVGSGMNALYT
jgi:hypothetical protein